MDKKYTVLIVDDAEHNIELMSEMLSDSYNILTAQTGTEALAIMRGENPPDAVLLDMLMPKPDGYDVLHTMNADEKLRSMPVVVVTADSDPTARQRSYDLGAVDFVSRGEDMSTVRRRVKSVLRLCELDKMRLENERLHREITSERRLSALMDNLPGGVAIIETNGRSAECTYYNNELLQLFKMNPDRFSMQFIMPVRPEWLNTFIEKAKTSDSFTFTFSIGDGGAGSRQWIRVTAGCMSPRENTETSKDSAKRGDIKEIYCVFLDINAEKRQELRAEENDRQLRENQTRLETVFNNAPGGLSLSQRGANGRFHTEFVNQGLADMLGYASCEECVAILSVNPGAGVSQEDINAMRAKIAAIPETGGDFKYVLKCRSYRREDLWLSMRCQMTCGEDGKDQLYSFITDITKEKNFEDELRAAAYFDSLTGLFNRHAFMRNARRLIDENPLTEFSLMRLNIGSFKVVNDLLGRDVGDKVLVTIADAVRAIFAGRGVFARFFADNFMILTPYSERGVHPQTILDAVQKAVSSSGLLTHDIQYYIGVYKITDRDMSVENMADRASIACRTITGSYHEHIAYYDEKMRLTMLEEQEICDESRHALENGEFCVYYQPVYGIKAKRFTSAEALVRWNHPIKGMISPGKFVPVFEKNGFIAELDIYVLERVCQFMKRRRGEGLPDFPVSVNISRMSLYDPSLFESISEITDRYGIDPKIFRIEITESAYNDNPAQLLETVGKLREKGYPVLMDDFGSGYSSLNTLKDIPIDILKLDMKFMQGFEKNGKVGTIVTSVSRMSKWLNIPMLAEGVETKEQFEFLESVGCAYIQGFYFSRPVPEEEFTRLIALENVSADSSVIENYELSEEVNELLGSSALVSKLISGAFGGFGIYEMYDGKLEAIRVNEGYARIMGYTPDDFNEEHINIWDMMPKEYAEVSRNACLEALRTDKAIHATVRRRDRNGKLLYLDGVHRKLGGTKENPIICIAFNDITEKIENDKKMALSENRIEELLKTTGSAIADIDFTTGDIFYAGDLRIFGFETDKVTDYIEEGNNFENIVHPDDREKVRLFHTERKPGRATEEFRLKNREDGKYYWYKFTELRTFEDGRMTRLIGIANNIDAEKQTELKLLENHRLVDEAMSRVGAGILTVEVSDNEPPSIIYSNDSFWSTIGIEKTDDADIFDKVYSNIQNGDLNTINEAVKRGGIVNLPYRVTKSDGKNAAIDLTVGLYNTDNGKRVYMVIVADVTEQYNNQKRLEAIVRNFHDGLALVNLNNRVAEIVYANDKFYSVLHVPSGGTERLNALLQTTLLSGVGTSDVHIKHGALNRTVRVRVDEIGRPASGVTNYIVAVSDVTAARAELKNRIAERMTNAAAGLYDEVVEVNYKLRTVKLISSRREPERAKNAKPRSMESIINDWGRKYVASEDYNMFKWIVKAPENDSDFTDSYAQIRLLDADGEYHTMGIVMVRSHTDVCMMFVRDKARFDNSLTSAQVAETYRLYKLVAEQTRTTVIEIDHVEKHISCSPSIKEYWAANLTDEQLSKYEYAKQGLIVCPADMEKYGKFLDRVYSSDEPQNVTLRLKMADESYKWCRITVSLSRGKDGRVLTSLCTINLVHDDVIARMKARETDELLRRTVAYIPVGVGVYRVDDGKPVSVYVSDKMNELIGAEREAYYNALDSSLNRELTGITAGMEGSRVTQLKHKDGSDFWLNTQYRVRRENGELMMYAAIADITDRVEGQRREAVREQMYQVLMNESGMIVFDYDPKTDLFTYLIYSGGNDIVSIEHITENADKFTLIQEDDRVNFVFVLKRMSLTPEPEEMIVRIYTDGYPRRYKAMFKSVADAAGNIFKVVGKIEDVEDDMSHLESIQEKAMYDSLCIDLFNKHTTEELIRAELERSTAGALMMIDIDDFKSINDTCGHVFGDEFLKKFASTVKSTFRESDIVGRYGGDEFFVFMPHATASLAEKKANRILEKVLKIDVPLEGGVKSSIGVSAVTPDNRDYTHVLKQADSALYEAKNRGKNCVVLFEDTMNEGTYRTQEVSEHGRAKVVLSSNPNSAASTIMRVFSALYSSANISEGIEQMLELVGKTYDVSRVYIFEDTEDGAYCCNTFEWCGEGVTSEKDALRHVSYEEDLGGNYRDNMDDDGIFYCHDINTLGDAQREILARQNIKSMLQCAIYDDGKFKGFVGFDECRNNRFWTQDQIDSLVFLSKVLSIFLMMDRTRTRAENYAYSLRSILDDFPQLLYIISGEDMKLLYCNKLAERKIGSGKLGMSCRDAICFGDPRVMCPIKYLQQSGESRPLATYSPILDQNVTVRAAQVQWEGKPAYLLVCTLDGGK